jgi:hypothetical protein
MKALGGLMRMGLLAVAVLLWSQAAPASAEPRRGRASTARPGSAAKRARPPRPARGEPRRQAPSEGASAPAATPGEAVTEEPAPTSTPRAVKPRVYSFGGLDVEGKLKAPQLLYFRSRMRQELDTSNEDTRSFLKELEKTADEKGL